MKQSVTKEQLNTLSDEGLLLLGKYCFSKGWCATNPIKNMPNGDGSFFELCEPSRLPSLSSGELLEFLVDKEYGSDWCDLLWQLVKIKIDNKVSVK